MSDGHSFFSELKRRNVYKVAAAYILAGWALAQGMAQLLPVFDVPNWLIRLIVLLIIIGFPVALVFAWIFQLTPEGLKRTGPVVRASDSGRRSRTWIYVVVISAAISVSLFFVGRYSAENALRAASSAGPEATKGVPQKSIAVLPFGNLSRDPDNEYFAAGIQDEIITRLAQLTDLKVISCTSTQRYKGTQSNLRQIANELGVTNILEGSVQRANDEVHVNVQLLNALTDSHLWADTFDRKLTDVFSVESDIAKTIAETLQAKLSGHEVAALAARPTENNAAHDLYLKGRFFWNKRTSADMKTALEYFKQAAAADPNYAVAYAGMADCYLLLPLYGGGDPAELYPQATAMAQKAISLDPNLGEPHASLGLVHALFDFDFPASVREFEEAIRLNPNYATAHHWFGDSVLPCLGEFDRANAEEKRALELDPLSIVYNVDLGTVEWITGRYKEAIAQFRKALEMDARNYTAHFGLGQALERVACSCSGSPAIAV
jgi:TolB-like protein